MTITTPLGAVLRDDQGVRLEFVRTFPTTVEDLWSAVTESDRCARWFGSWTGDPTTGTVELVMTAEDGAPSQTVTIEECTAPTRLVVELPTPDDPWRLMVEVAAIDDGSRLTFTQRLAEPSDASGVGPGWHYYLDRLDAVVTGGEFPTDWSAYDDLGARYPLPG